jgi:hypothetical protein
MWDQDGEDNSWVDIVADSAPVRAPARIWVPRSRVRVRGRLIHRRRAPDRQWFAPIRANAPPVN